MRIIILPTADAVADAAANEIKNLIIQKSNAVLGLATGSTPLKTYQRLIDFYRQKTLSFEKVISFNLDEYIGLSPEHSQSYRYFMNDVFFKHIDIQMGNTYIPDGEKPDYKKSCLAYENNIAQHSGIDLQLLGLGENGHIGFNEPTSSLASRTRLKTLSPRTIKNNSRFFSDKEFQPQMALTMGIETIMEAKRVLLIATGHNKRQAIKDLIEGPLSAMCPASILQQHPQALIIIDKTGASKLAMTDYYLHVEKLQQTATHSQALACPNSVK